MKSIDLSITPNYVNWEIWQGVREFIQNAKDADTKGYPAHVSYDKALRSLTISNEGATLERSTLLLGNGDKRFDSSQIGGFGEGYKLALATLIGQGMQITIHTNNEKWVPHFSYSDVFDSTVISIGIFEPEDTEHNAEPYVEVEIVGITEDQWAEIECKFLFLNPLGTSNGVTEFDLSDEYETVFTGSRGDIIDLGHTYSTGVFVRGIYVGPTPQVFMEDTEGYAYSYNLNDLTIDRDRTMFKTWEFHYELNELMIQFAEESREDFLAAYPMDWLVTNKSDILTIATQGSDRTVTVNIYVEEFLAKHGANAYPYASGCNEQTVRALGKEPILVTSTARMLLCKVMGELSELIYHDKHTYTPVEKRDLSNKEFGNWEYAMKSVCPGTTRFHEIASNTTYHVVEYKLSDETDAHYSAEDNAVYVSRKLLSNKQLVLAATVREACLSGHDRTQDEYPAAIANVLTSILLDEGAVTCKTSLT